MCQVAYADDCEYMEPNTRMGSKILLATHAPQACDLGFPSSQYC